MSSQEVRVLMRVNTRYNHSFEPEADLVFCSIAELMDNECPNSPCQDCYLYEPCLRWWDKICNQSCNGSLPDTELQRARSILKYMRAIKKLKSMGYRVGVPF